MNGAVVIPNCGCSHAAWRHVAETSYCRRPGCGCRRYRPPAPEPSPEEQAVIERFGIFGREEADALAATDDKPCDVCGSYETEHRHGPEEDE